MGAGSSGRSMYRLVTRHRGRERVHAAPPATSYRHAVGLVQNIVRQQHAAGDPPVRVLLQRRFPRQNGHAARRAPGPAPLDAPTPAADSGIWITVESWDECVVARILGQQPGHFAGADVKATSQTTLSEQHGAPPAAGRPLTGTTPIVERSATAAEPPAAPVEARPTDATPRQATDSIPAPPPLPRPVARHRRSRWSLATTLLVLVLAWAALAALLAGWPGCGWLPAWAAPPTPATQPALPFDGPLLDADRPQATASAPSPAPRDATSRRASSASSGAPARP